MGMNILQGTPSAGAIACSIAQSDAIETTVASSKSESSWKNSCRRFTLTPTDGSVHTANFHFNK
jgi:hypothetical protein